MMMLELSPGDIETRPLTAAQAQRRALPDATADFIAWLCDNQQLNWQAMADEFRKQYVDIGHARTPAMLGRLLATINVMMTWLQDRKFMSAASLVKLGEVAGSALLAAATAQADFLGLDTVLGGGSALLVPNLRWLIPALLDEHATFTVAYER